ncbi:MAG: NarK/NasA family nitrate transporter [Planctomycetes bacterium]|nr:NarK/NasA family nitrate transporter [Planctomycetota bacterium]
MTAQATVAPHRSTAPDVPPPEPAGSWIKDWRPEDPTFWANTGSRVGWRTLFITTISLSLSFSTWFVFSALAVRLPAIGFKFSEADLFWLTAMPGLAGGSLRMLHMFLIPILGTRTTITAATLLKIIPCVGIGIAVMDPTTPFWLFMVWAFLAGMGGGDFSSFMPSTSVYFPKRLQGTALGIQAGIGNFGVSLTQFVTPWIVTLAMLGPVVGAPQTLTTKKGAEVVTSQVWLQSAAFWYVPLLLLFGAAAWIWLRSVPVKASFKQQLDIFKSKHTWFCTVTYVMTFGSFSGFSAAFPMLIKSLYGGFPNAPDALKYAFLGPLVGSTVRVFFGWLADKTGGGILTQLSGLGMIGCIVAMGFTGVLAPTSVDQFPLFLGLMLGVFFFSGMGNGSTFRQYPVIFAANPRQGAGVIGFTAAVAAYGPFVFSTLVSQSISSTQASAGVKSALPFFIGAGVFYAISVAINWYFYVRKGCERPS